MCCILSLSRVEKSCTGVCDNTFARFMSQAIDRCRSVMQCKILAGATSGHMQKQGFGTAVTTQHTHTRRSEQKCVDCNFRQCAVPCSEEGGRHRPRQMRINCTPSVLR